MIEDPHHDSLIVGHKIPWQFQVNYTVLLDGDMVRCNIHVYVIDHHRDGKQQYDQRDEQMQRNQQGRQSGSVVSD
jgi:hypothetical protein